MGLVAPTELLQLLADGRLHSGQELASALGVSRTAVWKQLRRLEAFGLTVEAVRSRGYRLPGGLDLLHRQRILDALQAPAGALLQRLLLCEVVDSTNAELFRQMRDGAPARGLVCAAEHQSAGRGRRGRAWISPYGGNLYLSLAWQFAGGAAALEGLSLAVGVAASSALAGLGVEGIALKWPNDLLHSEAKLGGILIEMSGDAAGSCEVVVGLGINVNMPPAAATGIDRNWTDVGRIAGSRPPGRNQLLAALLNQLLPLLDGYERSGFAPWRERWQALDAWRGQAVVVSRGDGRSFGTARGVDGSGALLLETGSGVEAVSGGEVSLSRAP